MEKEQPNFDKWGFDVEIPDKKRKYEQLIHQDSLIRLCLKLQKLMVKYDHIILEKDNRIFNRGLYKKIVKDCLSKNIKLIFINPPEYYLLMKR